MRLLAVALAAATLTGCQNMQINADNAAMVRVIDASPDVAGMDLYENGSPVAYNLSFSTTSSYVPLLPGTHVLSANMAGSRQMLISSTAMLANSKQYTAIIGSTAASLRETILQDATQPAPAGQVSFRLLNESTHHGAVDVYLVPDTGKLSTTMPLVTGLSFGMPTGYFNMPAGTYAVDVVKSGTLPTSATPTLLSDRQIAYDSGAVRTVVLIDGRVTLKSLQAIVADDVDAP
jgi:hypothetical protein